MSQSKRVLEQEILAIGGPKHLEMLPYVENRYDFLVPVPKKVKFTDLIDNPFDTEIETHKYFLQLIRNGTYEKMVWVSQDVASMNKAEELLKQALLELWVSQPYR